jgi:hypothetical protein
MPSVSVQEQHTISLPAGWAVPRFSLNQYVAWSLGKDGEYHGFGRVMGLNYEGKTTAKGDGYYYNIVVDPNCECYQNWTLADDDLGQVFETFYSYQLTAVPNFSEQGS